MKKNEYVSPEMEVVEIKGMCSILAGSGEDGEDQTTPSFPGIPNV